MSSLHNSFKTDFYTDEVVSKKKMFERKLFFIW